MPLKNMNAVTIASTYTELKEATLALRVEKPPVAMVDMEWDNASYSESPAALKRMVSISVSPK